MLGRSIRVLWVLALFGGAAAADRMDQPSARVWTGRKAWNAAEETAYSEFVAALGRGAAGGRCHTLAACLNDPAVNPLWERGAPLRMHADCADVPYMLRAYFALRHDLPFVWAEHMQGRGRDERYLREARPTGLRTWHAYKTARLLLAHIGNEVSSGWFRTAPELEGTDTYPTRITRQAIHAGTIFYDPNGHVLVVYEVRPSGEVLFFDGHPDGSLTHTSLNGKQVVGGPRQGGGFRNFRPFEWTGTRPLFAKNAEIADYDPIAQGDATRRTTSGRHVSFVDWVRSLLGVVPAAPPRT
jgi:hypothetical protein